MLHRFAQFVAGCTVLLVLAGSLVTSTGSGLSVPDWPTSYGWNMFTFPPSKWVGGILYEHGHRLIASTVGCLTIVLAAWLWTTESRRWMKWLGVSALGAVVAQGVLGGLTVLFYLPAAISTAHAGLAEVFLCLVVSIALFTSPGWLNRYGRRVERRADAKDGIDSAHGFRQRRMRVLATGTAAVIYAQILLGATMRHTGAGLAIPDFPLMLGHVVPPHWDPKIAIHFSHRVGALAVIVTSFSTAGYVRSRWRDRLELQRPAALLVALVTVQAALGALTVLSGLNVWFNSVHVVCGALVLSTSVVLALRTWRGEFADGETVRLATPRPALQRTSPKRGEAVEWDTTPAAHATGARETRDVRSVRLQPDRGGRA